MADIEKEKFRKIAIDLINEYRVRGGVRPIDWLVIDTPEVSAFIRSIQLHEKTKKELQDVKQELHDFKQMNDDDEEQFENYTERANATLAYRLMEYLEFLGVITDEHVNYIRRPHIEFIKDAERDMLK